MGFPALRLPWSKPSGSGATGLKAAGALAPARSGSNRVHASVGFPIAVDFGAASLKLLQLQEGDPPTLGAAACLETPMPLVADTTKRLEFQFDALSKLVRMGKFRGRRAVCSIPAAFTSLKHLQLPRTEGITTRQLVESSIPSQFNTDLRSLVYRYFEVPAGDRPGNRVDVVIIAVSRDVVARLMEALVAAKLEPVGIHSEWVAALGAFDQLHRRDVDEMQNTLYLDVGAMSTKVMISHGKSLAFARSVSVGGYRLDQLIAQQLVLEEKDARMKRIDLDLKVERVAPAPSPHVSTAADPEADRRTVDTPLGYSGDIFNQPEVAVAPVGATIAEPLEMLTDELKLCLRYHSSQFPARRVDSVVFVGGEARHRGLVQHIARALRLPAQVADPMARVARSGGEPLLGVDFTQSQPGWAVALGLCTAPTDL